MVTLLLVLIICILLFGPFGLGVFAGILIYILPFYIFFTVLKMIFDHRKKCPRKDKDNTKERSSKTTVLVKDGKWVGNKKSRKS